MPTKLLGFTWANSYRTSRGSPGLTPTSLLGLTLRCLPWLTPSGKVGVYRG